jgi:glycosyltransferase involved in cell wall biosynthesis
LKTSTTKKISLVIPVFNEASNLNVLYKELIAVLSSLSYEYEIIFVDDGSTDDSLVIIKNIAQIDPNIFFIELSRNFGHQYALKAGLDICKGDCVISMDSDLQHPPGVIKTLLEKWEEGFEVVYTRREEDKRLSWLKRKTSSFFYRLLNKLSDLNLEQGTADFRLMSRNMINAFAQLNENDLFIRGLVKWAGFRQIAVDYSPAERYSGKSKYSLGKMLSFGMRSITSFSVRPLKLIAYAGMVLFFISLLLIPYAVISFVLGFAVPGWASLMITVIFFSSLQLLMLGIMGIYISKIAVQSKQRPLYFIRETNYNKNAKEETQSDEKSFAVIRH